MKIKDALDINVVRNEKGHYLVTGAPETYTWAPENEAKVMAWLESQASVDEDGCCSDCMAVPEFLIVYDPIG